MAGTIDLGIDNIIDAREIGRGGFSTVYAAVDKQFDRKVAIKVLRPLTNESDRNRFERECKVMGRLSSNDGVVTVFNAGYTTNNEPYIVMALNEGGSLADLLDASGPIDWKRACDFMIPIADALGAAHEAHILHRDVKPENVLVEGDRARLTDFGIAHLRGSGGSTSTNITASWLHTAPETFDNKRDERSDVYSAASTLYCLIAGRAPFQDPTDESLNPLMRRLLDQDPPLLGPTRVPVGLDQYLQRCLAKNPADRPQTARELADGLRLLVQSDGSRIPPLVPAPDSAPGWVAPAQSGLQPGNSPDPKQGPAREPNGVDPVVQASWVRPAPVALPPAGDGTGPGAKVALLAAVAVAAAVVIIGGLSYAAVRLGRDSTGDVAAGSSGPTEQDPDAPSTSVEAVGDDAAESEAPAGEETSDEAGAPDAGTGRGIGGADQPVVAPVFDGEAKSIDELEARWAESRAAVVASLSSDAYGIDDDNVLRGPAGFELDLNQCPSDWSDTAGLTDSSIAFGHPTPQSGDLAAFSDISTGMDVYFDYVNANGGIGGRQIDLILKDDAYDVDLTIETVDELLAENAFGVTTLGSPNSLAVLDTLNAACVPQPFVLSAHPAFGDPQSYPFTTGLQLSYATEARMWGAWIENNFAGELPVTVSAVVMDNDFGLAYQSAFESWVAENPDVVSEVAFVPHAPNAATLTAEIEQAFSTAPEVFIAMTAGAPCLLALEEAGLQGFRDGGAAYIQPPVCKDPVSWLMPAGNAADGVVVVGGGQKVATDPQFADDPFVSFMNTELDAAGLNTANGLFGSGFGVFGWAQVEAMRIADELPGGLTRTNLLLAMRGLELEHPMLLDGVGFRMWGNEDSFPVEASDVARYDSAQQGWIDTERVIDIEGETPNCSWGSTGCS